MGHRVLGLKRDFLWPGDRERDSFKTPRGPMNKLDWDHRQPAQRETGARDIKERHAGDEGVYQEGDGPYDNGETPQ